MPRCYNFGVRVSELGEIKLIELISGIIDRQQKLPAGRRQKLIAGIGDDAAAWQNEARIALATVDCLTQDVHFSPETASWDELGWKALAISLSDIAAMGGTPEHALISLGLPGETGVDSVAALYGGMLELANRFGVSIAGGNISRSDIVFINTAVLGSAGGQDKLLRRSEAKPGDVIAVTGYLGGAAAGLEMLNKGLLFDADLAESLRAAFFKPNPRVAEGQLLARMGVKAATDISDGLLADLGHICQASKAGARVNVDCLPVSPGAEAAFPQRALEMALGGGEDYELVFCAGPRLAEKAKVRLSCPVTVIGTIVPDIRAGISLFKDGKPYRTEARGWQHFASKD